MILGSKAVSYSPRGLYISAESGHDHPRGVDKGSVVVKCSEPDALHRRQIVRSDLATQSSRNKR